MQIQFKEMPVQAARPLVERRAGWLGQARDGEGSRSACSFGFAFASWENIWRGVLCLGAESLVGC